MNPPHWLELLSVWNIIRTHLNKLKCYHPAQKAALRAALQWRHIIQLTRAFLCEMRLDAASLHQIRAERHCRATLQVRVPRQVPLDRPWTQPRSPKFSTSNRRENQKAMLSAGIIYRKQPELKRDSFFLPISSRKLYAPPRLVHNKALVHGARICRLQGNTSH